MHHLHHRSFCESASELPILTVPAHQHIVGARSIIYVCKASYHCGGQLFIVAWCVLILNVFQQAVSGLVSVRERCDSSSLAVCMSGRSGGHVPRRNHAVSRGSSFWACRTETSNSRRSYGRRCRHAWTRSSSSSRSTTPDSQKERTPS